MEKFATLRSQLGILQAFGWESPVMLITLDGKSWSGLGRLVVEGDKDLEGAAFTHNAGDVDCAVVFFNDPAGNRETYTRGSFLRAEIWLENSWQNIFRHARPVVSYLYGDRIAVAGGRYPDVAVRSRLVASVLKDVQ